MIILHIGLPKTGTTFLQQLFGHVPDLAFVHRKMGAAEAGICHDLRRLGRANPLLGHFYRHRFAAQLRRLVSEKAGSRNLLVSDEDVSVAAGGFWRGAGPRPQGLSHRLAALGRQLGPAEGPLRVIIGIRRQDQWLASRYAESSRMYPDFGQDDFNARLTRIADTGPMPGPLGWLDYHHVRECFARALSAENVLLLPLEHLAGAPDHALKEIGRFLGGIELSNAFAIAHRKRRRRNRLSIGENAWRLRRDGTPLTLAPELQAALRARFAASNRALAEVMPLGFEP